MTGVEVEDPVIAAPATPNSARAGAAGSDVVGWVAVIVIATAASLGLSPWLNKSMFADEGATLYSAHLSWSNLWAQSRHVDLVLLPYYVVIHFWIMISGSVAFIRALSLLGYFGTVTVVGRTGLRLAGRWCGIIAAVLTATSTLLVLKSLNARPYELSAILVALCALALIRWLEDQRSRWLWAFSGLAFLATAMQLFALLAPGAMLLGVLVVRPGLFAQRLRVLVAPTAVLAIPSLIWLVACKGEVGQVNWIGSGSSDGLLTEVRGPVIGQLYDLILLIFVAIVVATLAAKWDRKVSRAVIDGVSRDREVLALMVGWAVLPTFVLSVASSVHPIYNNRYVTESAPGVALLVAFICVRVFPDILNPARAASRSHRGIRQRRWGMALAGAAAAGVLTIGYLSSASSLQEDLRGPARYVALHAQNGDVIALPDHAITAAVGYYLSGDGRHLPLWPQRGVRQRFVEGLVLSFHPYSVGRYPRRVWLVTDGSVDGVGSFQGILHQDGYVLDQEQQFTSVTLLLYRLD